MTTLIDVHLPHMGVVEQAVLTSWLRSPGDRVEESEPLCEVSTDKVDTEVASPVSGVLVDYVAQVEDEVPVGAVIARFAPLGTTDEEIAEAIRRAADEPATESAVTGEPPVPSPEPAAAENGSAGKPAKRATPRVVTAVVPPADASLVLKAAWLPLPVSGEGNPASTGNGKPATPLVRKLVKERGLDLALITGSGPGGRVTRKDVESATAALASEPRSASVVKAAAPARSGEPALPNGYQAVPYEAVPLTPQRRAIARNLLESVSTAPQLTAQVDVDMSAVSRVRAEVNEHRSARGEAKLSFLPFIARALCATINDHPDLNATFTDEHLIRWRPVNLGIAVDAPQGLLVPVVRDAERLTVPALADAISRLTGLVQTRKVTADDLAGGTVTLSNSGSVGGVIATPILTRPQVASLGVPAIIRKPVAVTAPDGEEYVAIRPVARFGLTFDHRAFDGVAALRALQSVQQKLESWSAEAYL